MGCSNGLTLSVSPDRTWEKGEYDIVVLFDGKTTVCTGKLPLRPCEDGNSFTCKGAQGVMITESGCALPEDAHGIGDIILDSSPKKVIVRITHDEKPFLTRTFTPTYKTFAPNGPGCGPVCTHASEDIFARP